MNLGRFCPGLGRNDNSGRSWAWFAKHRPSVFRIEGCPGGLRGASLDPAARSRTSLQKRGGIDWGSPFFGDLENWNGDAIMSSMQHKLDRVRRPRVQITYDVETNGAMQKVELPFVVGVLADLSGSPRSRSSRSRTARSSTSTATTSTTSWPRLAPRLAMKVENKLTDDGHQAGRRAEVQAHRRLRAGQVAEQVGPLKELLEMRHAADPAAQQDGRQRQARTAPGRRPEQHRQGQGPGQGTGHRGRPPTPQHGGPST